jgi:hypothetical protein
MPVKRERLLNPQVAQIAADKSKLKKICGNPRNLRILPPENRLF